MTKYNALIGKPVLLKTPFIEVTGTLESADAWHHDDPELVIYIKSMGVLNFRVIEGAFTLTEVVETFDPTQAARHGYAVTMADGKTMFAWGIDKDTAIAAWTRYSGARIFNVQNGAEVHLS